MYHKVYTKDTANTNTTLTTIISRLCVDYLHLAHRGYEEYLMLMYNVYTITKSYLSFPKRERNKIMYHLAQVNIARMLAPLDDPLMSGFVEQLDTINALADSTPGFVWRLQTAEGNATALRPYDDDLILVNLSLWASLSDLSAFVYKSGHRSVLQRRSQWFQRFDGPYTALWWVPCGHIPSVEEAKQRLDYLRAHGETPYAFSFKKPFPAPEDVGDLQAQVVLE